MKPINIKSEKHRKNTIDDQTTKAKFSAATVLLTFMIFLGVYMSMKRIKSVFCVSLKDLPRSCCTFALVLMLLTCH